MAKIFGTDGVRGIANQYPMTSEMAMAIGRATAYLFFNRESTSQRKKPPQVVIGKDTRLSGYMLENALAAGFCSMGARVFLVGPMPTPGIAFTTRSMRADVGVVISASHNLFNYNGIKIFDRDGLKLSDEMESQIESLLHSPEVDKCRPINDSIGRAIRIDDAIGRYNVFVKDVFPQGNSLDGVRLVLDCANGAAYKVAPLIFEELGAEVFPLHCNPNGKNINEDCGATSPSEMCRSVHTHRAEIGIALDGDADRVILADENGEMVDGDQILAICANQMLREGTLKNKTVVATSMSNMALEIAIEKMGGQLVRAPIGDRYVVEAMRTGNYNLGGEQSGHIVFLDHNTTGDGIMAALKVLSIMIKTKKPLSELKKIVSPMPQILLNVPVREKQPLDKYPSIVEAMGKVEKELGKRGRLVVRYSGTEPLARVMVEGEDGPLIESFAQDIAQSIRVALS